MNEKTGLTSQIKIDPQPLKLSVDTATDWPTVIATMMVGVGSILTTLLVGWLSHANQRSQIRSATANFRHGWQVDLRQTTARFLSVVAKIHFEYDTNPEYSNSKEANKDYSDLIENQAMIELMLDTSKDYTPAIIGHLEKIIQMLRSRDVSGLTEQSNKLTSRVNKVLEQTWDDIRRDLGAKLKS